MTSFLGYSITVWILFALILVLAYLAACIIYEAWKDDSHEVSVRECYDEIGLGGTQHE